MQLNIVKASLKELRMTPRKVSEVAALIRDRSVEDALVILSHTPRRAAQPVAKLIESARANAVNNHGLKAEGLKIDTISVTAGPRLKRYRPVSRGRAHPFQKRTSHIYVTLSGNVKPVKKAEKASETKSDTAAEKTTVRKTSAKKGDK
jgi:large subunit ribosomal protein L22